MGAGRRVQTVMVDSSSDSRSVNHRGLKKEELGGVIFVCSNETQEECISKNLFGLTRSHLSYVLNIEEGMPLFLFNYDKKLLHGLYVAASDGGYNLEAHAWTDGKAVTRYPAQVRVKLERACAPVQEKVFSRVIRDNYLSVGRFMFELTKKQTRELTQLFKPVGPATVPPVATVAARGATVPGSTQTAAPRPSTASKVAKVVPVPNAWKQVVKSDAKPAVAVAVAPSPPVAPQPRPVSVAVAPPVSVAVGPSQPRPVSVPLSAPLTSASNELSDSVGANMAESVLKEEVERPKRWHEIVEEEEKPMLDRILENLQMPDNPEQQKKPLKKVADVKPSQSIKAIPNKHVLATLEGMELSMSKLCSEAKQEIREAEGLLNRTMEELRVKGECLKELDDARQKNVVLAKKSMSMVQEIANLRYEVDELKLQCREIAQAPARKRSLFLVGGFNGSSRLNNFDKFLIDKSTLEPAASLLTPRSCGGCAVLHEQLYVFGGLTGQNWINTVEKYDPERAEWSSCHPLKIARGMLAGVTNKDKIYAMGGRNCNTFHSEMETFDPELGWLSSVSMNHKRCSLTGAANRGAIYTFGGTDGVGKMDNVERFDPRESMWSELKPMPCRRVWHCSTTYEDRIYMIGGFDGTTYLTDVERYDVRAGKWESVAKIHQPRSHGGAAVIDGTICLIGGLDRSKNYIRTVEYFNEDTGWTEVDVGDLINRSLHCVAVL